MKVISVRCPSSDGHLHLAPYQAGIGTSVFTLCLERWTEREPARQDSKLCTECVQKWHDSNSKERSK